MPPPPIIVLDIYKPYSDIKIIIEEKRAFLIIEYVAEKLQ